jgi:hypothetical protein
MVSADTLATIAAADSHLPNATFNQIRQSHEMKQKAKNNSFCRDMNDKDA